MPRETARIYLIHEIKIRYCLAEVHCEHFCHLEFFASTNIVDEQPKVDALLLHALKYVLSDVQMRILETRLHNVSRLGRHGVLLTAALKHVRNSCPPSFIISADSMNSLIPYFGAYVIK